MTNRQPLLQIGLSAWIIQDGNYPNFERGSTARFALEFYSERGLAVIDNGFEEPGLVHRGDGLYSARGVVRFCTNQVWVVDFNDIMAYREEQPPSEVSPGVAVTGELYLGIDPFFYFEKLSGIPGIPPLIYEWQIEGIQMETAPFVDSFEASGRKIRIRDQTKLRRVPVTRTDAWKDDGGLGDYLLECQLVSAKASRHLDREYQ